MSKIPHVSPFSDKRLGHKDHQLGLPGEASPHVIEVQRTGALSSIGMELAY